MTPERGDEIYPYRRYPLGHVPDSDKLWELSAAAISAIRLRHHAKAKELRVDCLFIAGDLFHRQPLRDLKRSIT